MLRRIPLSRSLRPSVRNMCRSYHASVLPSLISTSSPEFTEKSKAMDALVADFEAKLATARLGGGAKAVERMRSKGKKLPRERSGITRPITMLWYTHTGSKLEYRCSLTHIHRFLSFLLLLPMMSTQITYLVQVSSRVLEGYLAVSVS